jgi:molybdopterin-guanine dinucleotide biosynthesis protein MobB
MNKCQVLDTEPVLAKKKCVLTQKEDLSGIPIVAVSGFSDSGKTTLVEKLVIELKKRGYHVATIKHTHHEIDNPGKDTERHLSAGSEVVMLANAKRLVVTKTSKEPDSITEMVRLLGDKYDLILCEGFKNGKLPKIAVCQNETDLQTMSSAIAVVTDTPLKTTVPQFGSGDVQLIADMLEREYILPHVGRLIIYVNGNHVPLIEFPRAIIASSIVGMLSALKGVDDIESVELIMTNPRKVLKP